MMPGDPLKFIVGEDIVLMSAEQKAEVLEKHGLNKPVSEQYLTYIGSILKGDLGYSYRSKKPVADIVSERLPWTLLLSITNIILSTIIGVAMGTWAAWNRGKKIDIVLNNIFVFF